MTGRASCAVWALLALLLAARAVADPEAEVSQKVKDAAAEGALDARPAPAGDEGGQGVPSTAPPPKPRDTADLPPSARPSVWRAGARAPAEVPAAEVVRTAARKAARERGGKGRPAAQGGEEDCSVEIVWHAPGSTP